MWKDKYPAWKSWIFFFVGHLSQTVILGSSAARMKMEDNFVLKQNTQDLGEMKVKRRTQRSRNVYSKVKRFLMASLSPEC